MKIKFNIQKEYFCSKKPSTVNGDRDGLFVLKFFFSKIPLTSKGNGLTEMNQWRLPNTLRGLRG